MPTAMVATRSIAAGDATRAATSIDETPNMAGEEAPRERSNRDSRNSAARNEDQRFPADQAYDAASG